jgi:hypothetical protein
MKIYFSEAPMEDIEVFGDEGTFVAGDRFGNDRYFYNGVEHGTNPGGNEEVRIFDGCNRSIPISVESIPDLIAALAECLANYNIIKNAEAVADSLDSDLVLYVEDKAVEVSE